MSQSTKRLSIEEKLSRARTQLLLNQPFFGTLCLRLKTRAHAELSHDGHRRTADCLQSSFVEKLTPAELEGVLAHEVMHCGLAHCRRGNRDAELWNSAADYAVNPILILFSDQQPAETGSAVVTGEGGGV